MADGFLLSVPCAKLVRQGKIKAIETEARGSTTLLKERSQATKKRWVLCRRRFLVIDAGIPWAKSNRDSTRVMLKTTVLSKLNCWLTSDCRINSR